MQDEGLPCTNASSTTQQEAACTREAKKMTPFNRKTNLNLCLAVLVLLAGSALAQDNAGAISPSSVLNGRNVLSLSHWNVKGARLLCVVSTSEPKGEQEFDVFRE